MHVGLNLLFLVPGYTGGTETYAEEMIPELVAAAPDAHFTAFVSREAAAETGRPWGELIPTVTVPVNARNRAQWVRGEQQLLPRAAAGAKIDLLHSLANTAPGWGRFRRVVTIHDLAYRLAPEAHLGLMRLGMRMLVPLAARRSDRIIVDTASTRDDVVRVLNMPSEKVDVAPLGLGARRRATPLPETDVRALLDAGESPIVLCAAAKRPHKNLVRLVAAVAMIPAQRRPLLVLPGYHTAYEDTVRARAEQLGVADQVRFLGWIESSYLEGLFAAAACFVFPSLLEGFGLPVLEAMARGVPVACSGRGALGEVAGDAALRFDPESEAEIADAIERLLSDPAEVRRLREAGHARVSQFSWQSTATATLASYRRALALGRHEKVASEPRQP